MFPNLNTNEKYQVKPNSSIVTLSLWLLVGVVPWVLISSHFQRTEGLSCAQVSVNFYVHLRALLRALLSGQDRHRSDIPASLLPRANDFLEYFLPEEQQYLPLRNFDKLYSTFAELFDLRYTLFAIVSKIALLDIALFATFSLSRGLVLGIYRVEVGQLATLKSKGGLV
jgi:hypothetical protein